MGVHKMKVLINRQWGGFNFSDRAIKLICKMKNLTYVDFAKPKNSHEVGFKTFDVDKNPDIRTDKDAVVAVEKLGDAASTRTSSLQVAEIPDGSYYKVTDYDGFETLYYSKTPIHSYAWQLIKGNINE